MIYLASSWKNTYYPSVLAALRAAGHEVYDFRDPTSVESRRVMAAADCECEHSSALAHGFKWSNIDPNWQDWTPEEYREQLYNNPLAKQQFRNDLQALEACDTCVLLLPCGRSAHTEAGWMAGQGKKVYVLIPEKQEPDLMYRLFTGVCTSIDELIQALA